MAAIDIGYGAEYGASAPATAHTCIDNNNAANDTGTLDTFEVFAKTDCDGFKIGTFYGSGTSWTVRDYESIGDVVSGSKQTYTGKSCSVSANDLLGFYPASGQIRASATGGGGFLYVSGDKFGAGETTYTSVASYWLSIYATGETTAAGWTTAKLGGIASASIIKVAGIAVASVKKVAGVAVQ